MKSRSPSEVPISMGILQTANARPHRASDGEGDEANGDTKVWAEKASHEAVLGNRAIID
jgi:hypothetical protein